MIETKAVFRRKDNEIETTDCVVDKVIRLSESEYDVFSRNLLRDWDFIRDNPIDTVVDAQGRHHCLLVLGEGRSEGILVNPEGGSYARYSAFIPDAASLYAADRYPSLAERTQRLIAAADYIVSMATEEWPEGKNVEASDKYAVSFRSLNEKFGISFDPNDSQTDVFMCMLYDRPEIASVRCNTEEFLVDAAPMVIDIEIETDETVSDIAEYTEKEFAAWRNLSDAIHGHWREDKRYSQRRDGVLYYIGGEEGQYMRVTNDALLTVGRYELACPGIEHAVLVSRVWKQYENYEQAILYASQIAGLKFTTDLFGEKPKEKPSVLEQIREARTATPAPHKQKDSRSQKEQSL